MIQFAYTILYVPDVTRSITFYEQAFGFQRKFISPDHQYGELNTGATVLSFCALELAKSNIPKGFVESSSGNRPFAIEIGFTTDDVVATCDAAIRAGATEEAPATTKPWGQTVAYVRDPDGFLIEICSPMA